MKRIVTLEQVMNDKNFEKEFNSIIINNDKPISIIKSDYMVPEGKPKYTIANKEGRSGTAIAIISKNTLAIYTSKNIDYPDPIGWTSLIKKIKIYNKSHIIGYSLSAKVANPNNMFIGTEYLNKITMKNIENELYNDIKKNNRRYIYKVTPKYRSPKDTVPFGILMEAETIDNLKKKKMCRFCYNIQNGVKINYYDGSNSAIEKSNDEIHKEEKTKKINKRNEENNKYRDYAINIKTKVFHLLNKRCNYIQKVEAKYIQETTAFENDIIEKGFNLCKKCTSITEVRR